MVERTTTVEVVAIDDRSAMGDVGVAVVDYSMVMPVRSPVMPPPTESSEEADSKSSTERDCRASKEDSVHRDPTWVGPDWFRVHGPRIIGRHVDDVWVGWLNDDRVAFRGYLLLLVAKQMPYAPSLLAHRLDLVHYVLLLVGICI